MLLQGKAELLVVLGASPDLAHPDPVALHLRAVALRLRVAAAVRAALPLRLLILKEGCHGDEAFPLLLLPFPLGGPYLLSGFGVHGLPPPVHVLGDVIHIHRANLAPKGGTVGPDGVVATFLPHQVLVI